MALRMDVILWLTLDQQYQTPNETLSSLIQTVRLLRERQIFNNRCSGIPPAIPEEPMPKVTVEIPQHIVDDLNTHVGDGKKFVSFSDAIRTALRKMLDHLDEVDMRRGR